MSVRCAVHLCGASGAFALHCACWHLLTCPLGRQLSLCVVLTSARHPSNQRCDIVPPARNSGGPYAVFAGRDASRGLATMSLAPPKEGWDDTSDLNDEEREIMADWADKFSEKYPIRYACSRGCACLCRVRWVPSTEQQSASRVGVGLCVTFAFASSRVHLAQLLCLPSNAARLHRCTSTYNQT